MEVNLSEGVTNSDWIIGNIRHVGFYRVNYDKESWKLLISQLNKDYKVIEEINRAVLIDDSFNLGKAELIDQTVFFEVVEYLKNEESDLPFIPAFYGLNMISDLLVDNYLTYERFKKYYMNLLVKQYNSSNWKDVTDPNKL